MSGANVFAEDSNGITALVAACLGSTPVNYHAKLRCASVIISAKVSAVHFVNSFGENSLETFARKSFSPSSSSASTTPSNFPLETMKFAALLISYGAKVTDNVLLKLCDAKNVEILTTESIIRKRDDRPHTSLPLPHSSSIDDIEMIPLWESSSSQDIAIVCNDGVEVQCHAFMLCAFSPILKQAICTFFQSQESSSTISTSNPMLLPLPQAQGNIFQLVKKWMYMRDNHCGYLLDISTIPPPQREEM